jgi:hypothetical protein
MGPRRVFKSHEASDPCYRRVIHIVRDPPDVAVSSIPWQARVAKAKTNSRLKPMFQRYFWVGTTPMELGRARRPGWLIPRRFHK